MSVVVVVVKHETLQTKQFGLPIVLEQIINGHLKATAYNNMLNLSNIINNGA